MVKATEAAPGLAALASVCPDYPASAIPWEWPPSLSGGSSHPSRKLFTLVSLPAPHLQRGTEGTTSGLMPCTLGALLEEIIAHLLAYSSHPTCFRLGRETIIQGLAFHSWNPEGHPQPQGPGSGQQPSRESHPCPICHKPQVLWGAEEANSLLFSSQRLKLPSWIFPLILPPLFLLSPSPVSPSLPCHCLPFYSSIFLSLLLLLIPLFLSSHVQISPGVQDLKFVEMMQGASPSAYQPRVPQIIKFILEGGLGLPL